MISLATGLLKIILDTPKDLTKPNKDVRYASGTSQNLVLKPEI